MPFVCEAHQVAYDYIRQMWGHYLFAHKGQAHPPKESLWLDELPAGVTLKGAVGGERVPRRSAPRDRGTDEPIEEKTTRPARDPERSSVYREAPSATGILENILSRFPGLPAPVRNEIMDWAEARGTALAPMEVAHLLEQMAGVPRGAANIIPQKYAFALDKAAREGNAEVRMLLTNWGTAGPQGATAGAMGGGWPGQPSWTGAGHPVYGAPWSSSWGPMAPWTQPRVDAEPAEDPRVGQLVEQVAELKQSNIALEESLRRKAEEQREERHRQELADIERRNTEQIAALHASIEQMRTALTSPDRSSRLQELEAKVDELREGKYQAQLTALEQRIADLQAKPAPTTGSTEMDVIRDTATGAIEAVKQAGGDIKTLVLAGTARENLLPGRRSAEERARLGQSLGKGLRQQDEAMADADDLFRVGAS